MAALGTMDALLADKNPVKPARPFNKQLADFQSQTITDKKNPTLVFYLPTFKVLLREVSLREVVNVWYYL